jgi:hypothetical protein
MASDTPLAYVPVPVQAVDLNEDSDLIVPTPKWAGIWIEVLALCLVGIGVVSSVSFWGAWIATTDRVICLIAIVLGLVIASARAGYRGPISISRLFVALVLWGTAVLISVAAFFVPASMPYLAPLSIGFAIAGWGMARVHGEHWAFGLSLGLAAMLPSLLECLIDAKWFDWLSVCAVQITAGLADITGLFYIHEGASILFAQGIAERFESSGNLFSAVTALGMSTFWILARRRQFAPGVLSLVMSVVAWSVVLALAWMILVHSGTKLEKWIDWDVTAECIAFASLFVLVLCLDQFVAAIFAPIPFEFINNDFPLFAMTWNWINGLPKLTLSVPQRESDFGPMEEESEEESQ